MLGQNPNFFQKVHCTLQWSSLHTSLHTGRRKSKIRPACFFSLHIAKSKTHCNTLYFITPFFFILPENYSNFWKVNWSHQLERRDLKRSRFDITIWIWNCRTMLMAGILETRRLTSWKCSLQQKTFELCWAMFLFPTFCTTLTSSSLGSEPENPVISDFRMPGKRKLELERERRIIVNHLHPILQSET